MYIDPKIVKKKSLHLSIEPTIIIPLVCKNPTCVHKPQVYMLYEQVIQMPALKWRRCQMTKTLIPLHSLQVFFIVVGNDERHEYYAN